MIQREARVTSADVDYKVETSAERPKNIVVHNWERPIFILALIAILALGFIGGMRSLLALFP